MKTKHYIALSLILIFSVAARAQSYMHINPNVLIDSIPVTTYTLNGGTPVNTPVIGVWVYNRGNSIFTDSIGIGYSINSGGFLSSYDAASYDSSGLEFHPRAIQVAPGDSFLLRSLIFHFNSPKFVVGSPTVVIWPILYNTPGIVDSAHIQLTITAPLGINDQEPSDAKVYMRGSNLIIRNDEENNVGDIRIYNVEGTLVASDKISQQVEKPMGQYAPGIYIVELVSKDGTRKVHKVFNGSQQ